MNIHQVRNATVVIDLEDKKILVDPMLAKKGSIPSLKWITPERKRNPLVELPPGTDDLLDSVTHVLITHCQKGHFDHLDRTAVKWIRAKNVPVICSMDDASYLRSLGLNVVPLSETGVNPFFEGTIRLVKCIHGRGVVGSFMAHGHGYLIELPNHPSLYLIGDSILTEAVKETITHNQPDIVIMPGGGAQFDLGGEIIMGLDDVVPMAKLVTGTLIINHLESLDHCPVSRKSVKQIALDNNFHRINVPEDGEILEFVKS